MNNSIIDGFESLNNLFKSEKDLIEHLIENSYFFHPDIVKAQALKISMDINNDMGVYVRFSQDGTKFYHKNNTRETSSRFKNKREAISFTKEDTNKLYHRETNIRVKIDNDGNYTTKYAIKYYTGHWVSAGKNSSVINYTIAHIWGKTDNPIFFSLMWNYCLIPQHISQLTDKGDGPNKVVTAIKNMLKAISIELYHPNEIMKINHTILSAEDMPMEMARRIARQYIDDGKIKFLPHINNK